MKKGRGGVRVKTPNSDPVASDRLFNKTFYLGIDAPVDILFDGICHQSLTCFCCASQFALTQIGK